jgi:hypothetical protein
LTHIARKNETDDKYFAGEATAKSKLANESAAKAEAEAALAQQETERTKGATRLATSQLTRAEWLLYLGSIRRRCASESVTLTPPAKRRS